MLSLQTVQALAREIMEALGGGYSEAICQNALYRAKVAQEP